MILDWSPAQLKSATCSTQEDVKGNLMALNVQGGVTETDFVVGWELTEGKNCARLPEASLAPLTHRLPLKRPRYVFAFWGVVARTQPAGVPGTSRPAGILWPG